MAEQISNQKVMDPSTFGLWGFAFATLLGNISALGAFGESSMLINNGIFLGGVAQFVTGMLCARRNNLAGLVTFGFFGLFWMIAGFEGLMGALGISHPAGGGAMGAYFAAWTLFCIMLTWGAKGKTLLFWTLIFVDLLLFFNMLGAWIGSAALSDLGACFGIISALMAIILGFQGYLDFCLKKE